MNDHFWYFNTDYPETGVHPIDESIENIQDRAGRSPHLIIFTCSVDEINKAERTMSYEQYLKDMARLEEKLPQELWVDGRFNLPDHRLR